jgi:hypothetical protein
MGSGPLVIALAALTVALAMARARVSAAGVRCFQLEKGLGPRTRGPISREDGEETDGLTMTAFRQSRNAEEMMKFYCSEKMTKQIGSTLIGHKQTRARNSICTKLLVSGHRASGVFRHFGQESGGPGDEGALPPQGDGRAWPSRHYDL